LVDQTHPDPTLPELRDRLARLNGLADWPALQQWSRLLDLVATRRSLPDGAPLLTVLVGPTGVGKSTLFNHLVGRVASATGAIRPCTIQPVGFASAEVVEFLRRDPWLRQAATAFGAGSADETPPPLTRQALVDTPDFDSVAEDNRRASELLVFRADRVIVVLSPEKYADASVWRTLETLVSLGSVVGCVFNKSEGGVALEDCTRLLEAAGVPPPVAVPRLPRPDDLDSLDPALSESLAALLRLPDGNRAVLAERRVAAELWEARFRQERVEPWGDSARGALERTDRALRRLQTELPQRIRTRLPLELDEALRRELQERFFERIQKYDPLRTPRRWLGAPVRWLVDVFSSRLGSSAPRDTTSTPTAEWLSSAYRDRYLEFVLDLAGEMRKLSAAASNATEPPLPWPEVPDPDPAAAATGLRSVFDDLQQELERESQRISESLSPAGKVGFFGSQAVFHLLMFAVLVHTGGGLSLGDLAAQGLVSPYLAKVFAQLVSSGEARAVGNRLEEFFARRIERELLPALDSVDRHAQALWSATGTSAEWQGAVRRWESEGRDAARA
jgi:energy-coupling factor transporter ATP-binding protein EcfA2